MDQQSFTYDAGTLFCTCCSTTVSFYHAAQHVKTRRDLLDAEREHTTAISVLQEATRVKDKTSLNWDLPLWSIFLSMAFECVQGAFDYFDHLYLKPHGDMYRLNIAFRGARVFNPIFVKELDVNASSLWIDEIAYFGIQKFTGQFLEGMKSELSLLLDHSRRPFDWSAVPGAQTSTRRYFVRTRALMSRLLGRRTLVKRRGASGRGGELILSKKMSLHSLNWPFGSWSSFKHLVPRLSERIPD